MGKATGTSAMNLLVYISYWNVHVYRRVRFITDCFFFFRIATHAQGASALVFHRDSPYFDFEPANVITVWIALDDMTNEVGPLEVSHIFL